MAAPYTYGTAIAKVQTEMNDPDGDQFTADIVGDFINEGQRRLADESGCLTYSAVIDIVSGQAEYDLSALDPECVEVVSVWLPLSAADTDEYPLEQISLEELRRDFPKYRTESGWPKRYMRWNTGLPGIRLHPTPDSDQQAQVAAGLVIPSGLYGGVVGINGLDLADATALYGATIAMAFKVGALRVDYRRSVAAMSAAGDAFTIRPQHQEAVIAYACWRCCRMKVLIAQADKADSYWSDWLAGVKAATTITGANFQRTPPKTKRVENF
jgi:hypothetical protein